MARIETNSKIERPVTQLYGCNTCVRQSRIDDLGSIHRTWEAESLPMVKARPGLVSVLVGTPNAASPEEFLMTSVWQDLDTLKGFAGDHWKNAVIDPGKAHLLKETLVYHYEAVAA